MASEHQSIPGATRHAPRDGGGHYSLRGLPKELAESEEAADVWAAAKAASYDNRSVEVRGWRVEWKPRAGHGSASKTKRGDPYIFQPAGETHSDDAAALRAWRARTAPV